MQMAGDLIHHSTSLFLPPPPLDEKASIPLPSCHHHRIPKDDHSLGNIMVAWRWECWMLLLLLLPRSLCFVDIVLFVPKPPSIAQRAKRKHSFGIKQTSAFSSFPFRLDPCWASTRQSSASSPQNRSSSTSKDDVTKENETKLKKNHLSSSNDVSATAIAIKPDTPVASKEMESATTQSSIGSIEPSMTKTASDNNDSNNKKNNDNSKQKTLQYDLPWTDLQQWALRDQLPKYTVQVPSYGNSDVESDVVTMQVLTLWRTMSNEVIELSGYPVEFLVERQMELQDQAKGEAATTDTTTNAEQQDGRPPIVRTSRTVLPYLDDFDFTPSGGLSGIVSGIEGVADGSRIETTPVGDIHSTIPKGYVRAGSVLYELGRPSQQQQQQLDNRKKMAVEQARSLAGSLTQQVEDTANERDMPLVMDRELVQLGALTAIIVTGAMAFETLSHHLTVNVFWV